MLRKTLFVIAIPMESGEDISISSKENEIVSVVPCMRQAGSLAMTA